MKYMKQQKFPPGAIRAFYCLIVPLIVLSGPGFSRGAQEAALADGKDSPILVAQSETAPAQIGEPIVQYTLTVSMSGSGKGKISSNVPTNVFKKGSGAALKAVPAESSVFAGWMGACSGTSMNCNVQMTSDKSVTAIFNLKTYTIRVPEPTNGVIHPSGVVKASYGEKRRFQMIPLPGYRLSEVLVDKASIGAVDAYTFENIRADHLLEAIFIKR